jgi:uncharacterized glyoxalase superfamily protein PhnB
MRSFVPAKDFDISLRFYQALGLTDTLLAPGLAEMQLGAYNFLLQSYDPGDGAQHFMMQLIVADLAAWWQRIEALRLAEAFAVPAPRPPAKQPGGLTVAYVVDPTGVLWHFVQAPR